MNRLYKSFFSKKLGRFIVASENARTNGKSSSTTVLAAVTAIGITFSAGVQAEYYLTTDSSTSPSNQNFNTAVINNKRLSSNMNFTDSTTNLLSKGWFNNSDANNVLALADAARLVKSKLDNVTFGQSLNPTGDVGASNREYITRFLDNILEFEAAVKEDASQKDGEAWVEYKNRIYGITTTMPDMYANGDVRPGNEISAVEQIKNVILQIQNQVNGTATYENQLGLGYTPESLTAEQRAEIDAYWEQSNAKANSVILGGYNSIFGSNSTITGHYNNAHGYDNAIRANEVNVLGNGNDIYTEDKINPSDIPTNTSVNGSQSSILGYANKGYQIGSSSVVGSENYFEYLYDTSVLGVANTLSSVGFGSVSGSYNALTDLNESQLSGNQNQVVASNSSIINGNQNNLENINQSIIIGQNNGDLRDYGYDESGLSTAVGLTVIGNKNNGDRLTNTSVIGSNNNLSDNVSTLVNGSENAVYETGLSVVNGHRNSLFSGHTLNVIGTDNNVTGENNDSGMYYRMSNYNWYSTTFQNGEGYEWYYKDWYTGASSVVGSKNNIAGSDISVLGNENKGQNIRNDLIEATRMFPQQDNQDGSFDFNTVLSDSFAYTASDGSVVTGNSNIFGYETNITGNYNAAFGGYHTVNGAYNTIIGEENNVSGRGNVLGSISNNYVTYGDGSQGYEIQLHQTYKNNLVGNDNKIVGSYNSILGDNNTSQYIRGNNESYFSPQTLMPMRLAMGVVSSDKGDTGVPEYSEQSDNSYILGSNNTFGESTKIVGSNNDIIGGFNTSIGDDNTFAGYDNTAIGNANIVGGVITQEYLYEQAVDNEGNLIFDYWGYPVFENRVAYNSYAAQQNHVSGSSNILMGEHNTITGDYNTIRSELNKDQGLIADVGSAMTQDQNALDRMAQIVGFDTNVSAQDLVDGNNANDLLVMSSDTENSQSFSNITGRFNIADGFSNITGLANQSNGTHQNTFGNYNEVNGQNNTVLGNANIVDGLNTIALGTKLEVRGDQAIAIGSSHNVDGDSIAIGSGNTASLGNIAIGNNVIATGQSLAREAYFVGGTAANQLVIGNNGNDMRITGVAAGFNPNDAVNVEQLTAVVNSLGDYGTVKYDRFADNSINFDHATLQGKDAVIAADTKYTHVQIVKDGGTVLDNVANAVEADHAVNKGQLDLAVAGLEDGLNGTVKYDRDINGVIDFTNVSLANAVEKGTDRNGINFVLNGGTTINNVANATEFHQAVNKGQLDQGLFAAREGVVLYAIDANNNINKDLVNFAGTTATVNAHAVYTAVQVVTNGGTLLTNVANATEADHAVNKGQLDLAIAQLDLGASDGGSVKYDRNADNSINFDHVTLQGKDTVIAADTKYTHVQIVKDGGTILDNVANAVEADHAVNKGQLDLAVAGLEDGLNGTVKYDRDINGVIDFTNVSLANAVDKGTDRNGIDYVLNGGTTINNVANATEFHQAVNKGQLDQGLFAAREGVVLYAIDANNNINKDLVNFAGTVATVDAHSVYTAVQVVTNGGTLLTNVANAYEAHHAVNKGQLDLAIAQLDLGASDGGSVKYDRDNTGAFNFDHVTLAGKDAVIAADTKYTHVQIVKDGGTVLDNVANATEADHAVNKGQLDLAVAGLEDGLKGTVKYDRNADDSINFDKSTLAGNTANIEKNDIGIQVVTEGGTVLANVGNATEAHHAVNKGQLDDAIARIDTSIDGVVLYDKDDKGNTNANSVTFTGDNAVVQSNNNGVYVVATGGTQLNNVANATEAHQAINKGQLDDALSKLGGDTTGHVKYRKNSDDSIDYNNVDLSGETAVVEKNANGIDVVKSGGSNINNVANAVEAHQAINKGQFDEGLDGSVQYARNQDGTVNKNLVSLGGNSAVIEKNANGIDVVKSGGTVIENVSNATLAHHAINKGQLDSGLDDVKKHADQGDINTLYEANSYTNKKVGDLWNAFQDESKDLRAGIAGAMAVGNLPQPSEAGYSMFSIGAATYKGQQALAMGLSAITEDKRYIFKIAATTTTRNDTGGAASVGVQWK